MQIYRHPVPITREQHQAVLAQRRARVDFRAKIPAAGYENLMLHNGSRLRRELRMAVSEGQYGRAAILLTRERKKLLKAPPLSLIGEAANILEAGLALAELVKEEPEVEFVAGTSTEDGKTYLAKGGEGQAGTVKEGSHICLLPFVLLTHKLDKRPLELKSDFPVPSYPYYRFSTC